MLVVLIVIADDCTVYSIVYLMIVLHMEYIIFEYWKCIDMYTEYIHMRSFILRAIKIHKILKTSNNSENVVYFSTCRNGNLAQGVWNDAENDAEFTIYYLFTQGFDAIVYANSLTSIKYIYVFMIIVHIT